LYAGILTSAGHHVPGLDELTFPVTQDTQETNNDLPFEVQHDVVEVQASEVVVRRRTAKGASHRSKKFDQKEDVVICSAWLNASTPSTPSASAFSSGEPARECAAQGRLLTSGAEKFKAPPLITFFLKADAGRGLSGLRASAPSHWQEAKRFWSH